MNEDNALYYESTDSNNKDNNNNNVLYSYTNNTTSIRVKYSQFGITYLTEKEPIMEEYRLNVIRLFGKKKGALAKQTLALIEEFNLRCKHHHTTSSMQGSDLRGDVRANIDLVRKIWLEQQRLVLKERECRENIGEIIGCKDKRTILKYYRLIFAQGCAREKNGHEFFIDVSGFTSFSGLDSKYEKDSAGGQG